MATRDYLLTLHDPSLFQSFVRDVNDIFERANVDKLTLVYHDRSAGPQTRDLLIEAPYNDPNFSGDALNMALILSIPRDPMFEEEIAAEVRKLDQVETFHFNGIIRRERPDLLDVPASVSFPERLEILRARDAERDAAKHSTRS